MNDKRIIIVSGHYGSGKTFIAVNYAIALAEMQKPVSIYDLDIVNPYYRTVDANNMLEEKGVETGDKVVTIKTRLIVDGNAQQYETFNFNRFYQEIFF